ncbi:MAG: HEAT repeat domain-containing protein [Phycisphaerales bacterium]
MKRTTVLSLLLSCLLALFGPAAFAQTLPPEISGHETVTDADKSQIADYVKANTSGLTGKPKDIKDSRKALLLPLEAPNVSLAFRTQYASELLPTLTTLAADPRDEVAFNALRIAGELATNNSVDLLINALKDKRPSVQYAALLGLARTFEIMDPTQRKLGGGVLVDRLDKAITAIGANAKAQAGPQILDGAIIALSKAAVINDKTRGDVQAHAVSELASIVQTQTGKLTGADSPARANALLRAALVVRTQATNNAANLGPQALKDAGGLAGDLLAAAARAAKAGNPDNLPLEQMVRAAEGLLFVANSNIPGAAPLPELGLADLVKAGKLDQYQTKVQDVIGKDGILCKPPYSYPPDRFK